MGPRVLVVLAVLLLHAAGTRAADLVLSARYPDGEPIPYVLDQGPGDPKYVVVLFPGGAGNLDPHYEGGRLAYNFGGNFLMRSRRFLVDADFATVMTNSTQSEERMQGLLDDLGRRFPRAELYVMGTSYGTYYTMKLAGFLATRVAGVIHTSAIGEVREFDGTRYANRHLIVQHREDTCAGSLFYDAETSHRRFGTELLAMEGGYSVGHPCHGQAHHGFAGIERETMAAIKRWIANGR